MVGTLVSISETGGFCYPDFDKTVCIAEGSSNASVYHGTTLVVSGCIVVEAGIAPGNGTVLTCVIIGGPPESPADSK